MLLRCYPKVTDFIYFFFNQSPSADYRFIPIYSYGFWVAMGFFAAASLAVMEMKRKEALGLLPYTETEMMTGEAPTAAELVPYFLFMFVVFFKIFGVVAYQPELSKGLFTLKDFMLSMKGNWVGGILSASALTYYFYYTKNKEKLSKPEHKKVKVYTSEGIGDLVIIAAVLGVLGSVLFNFLETPGDYGKFWDDPIGFLTSGLSVYGGLICAGLGFAIYAWRKKLHFGYFFDCIAPGFILANGLGRLGCQTAGDGDWGLANTHLKPDWMPQFLWADNYAHHIVECDIQNGADMFIPNCTEEHCCQLVNAVYPTPLYEFLMCFLIFVILWSLRKRLTYKPGLIFGLFMIMIGIQRYTIEQWRDLSGRDLYHVFGFAFKQSELISIVLFLIGLASSVYLYSYYKRNPKTP